MATDLFVQCATLLLATNKIYKFIEKKRDISDEIPIQGPSNSIQLASANLTMCLKNKVKEVWFWKFAPDAQNQQCSCTHLTRDNYDPTTNHSQQSFTLDEQFEAPFLFFQYLSNRDSNELLRSI